MHGGTPRRDAPSLTPAGDRRHADQFGKAGAEGAKRRAANSEAHLSDAPAVTAPLPPIREKHPPLPVQVHTVVMGGMPGWQIALIAAGAALLAATVAVLAYRTWTARRKPVT